MALKHKSVYTQCRSGWGKMAVNEQHRGLIAPEIIDVIAEEQVVYVPVTIRRIDPDGSILVRNTRPHGSHSYFWVQIDQVKLKPA